MSNNRELNAILGNRFKAIDLQQDPFSAGVLLSLNVNRFGGHAKVQDDLMVERGFDSEMVKAITGLLTKEGLAELKGLDTIKNRAKVKAEKFALHTPFRGLIFIPGWLVERVEEHLLEEKKEYERAVDSFLEAYEGYKADFEVKYPDIFDPAKYPTKGELKDRFQFEWAWRRFEPPANLPPEILEREIAKYQADGQKMVNRLVIELAKGLREKFDSLDEQTVQTATIYRKGALKSISKMIQDIAAVGERFLDSDVKGKFDAIKSIVDKMGGYEADLSGASVDQVVNELLDPMEEQLNQLEKIAEERAVLF